MVRIFLYSGKYRPEITPYLDTFHAVNQLQVLRTKLDLRLELWLSFIKV